MKQIMKFVLAVAAGGSVLSSNCTSELLTTARDGALSAWESFVDDTVGTILDDANILDADGDGA